MDKFDGQNNEPGAGGLLVLCIVLLVMAALVASELIKWFS